MGSEEGVRPSKTFRIFVSSTFSDLKAERDALQRYVFPRLRELCAKNGARFQAIDLRWGVSEEAGLDQRTMPICLGEIERCQKVTPRPNFLVLLGDRYGWRPLPPEIPATEFAAIEAEVAAANDKSLLKTWYRLDENANPPSWCLQPRKIDIDEPATPEARIAATDREKAEWADVEARLRAILCSAVAVAGFDENARVRYEASATEQEILRGAMQVPDAAGHVFGFFRALDGEPTDASGRDFFDGTVSDGRFAVDRESHDRQTELKDKKLRPLLGKNVHDYRASLTSDGITTDHIGSLPDDIDACRALLETDEPKGSLCLDVWRSLGRLIRDELDMAAKIDQQKAEIWAHEDFGRDRCAHFVGREEPLAAIAGYLKGGDTKPLAIVGEPGSGKSALMAKAIEQAQLAHSNALVVYRFIGATPASSDGRALLDSLCRQITRAYSGDESTIPSEYNDLALEFGKRLELAEAERPLIVVLDALDQLSGTARSLSWLPANLPANVRLAVSTLPGECEKALVAKHPTPDVVTVKRMSSAEADTLLTNWLGHAGRALQPAQRTEVLDRFGRSEGLPLYLRLAFEEARLWRSYTSSADTVLNEGVQGLIRKNLFPRLSQRTNHGDVLVRHALGYLAASRFGLSEDEVLDVLSADDAVLDDFAARSFQKLPERRLPIVVWSRLYFDVEPYLAERSSEGTTLLAFYHNQLREAATAECLEGGRAERRNAALAGYFRVRSDPAKDRSWTGGYARGLSELPFHLAGAGDKDELFATLTDFTFLEHKAAEVAIAEHPGVDGKTTRTYAGVYQLQDDYELAIEVFGGGRAGARKPLIVTGTDLGQGMKLRCPWCNASSPFNDKWRGTDIACPNCEGPLRVSAFMVGK
jgi:NACHT domain- and WD repeat-containing protein